MQRLIFEKYIRDKDTLIYYIDPYYNTGGPAGQAVMGHTYLCIIFMTYKNGDNSIEIRKCEYDSNKGVLESIGGLVPEDVYLRIQRPKGTSLFIDYVVAHIHNHHYLRLEDEWQEG